MQKKYFYNLWFLIMVGVALAYVCSPFLIKVPSIYLLISDILGKFNSVEYKIAYINTVGALLGTFLAVSGALWTQQRENKRNDLIKKQKTAFTIKMELETTLMSLSKFAKAYACIGPNIDNGYDDLEFFLKFKKAIYVDTDSEWKNKIAEINTSLSNDDIEKLYKIFRDLSLIESIWNRDEKLITEKQAHMVYNIICSDLIDLTFAPSVETEIKQKNKDILEKLNIIVQ